MRRDTWWTRSWIFRQWVRFQRRRMDEQRAREILTHDVEDGVRRLMAELLAPEPEHLSHAIQFCYSWAGCGEREPDGETAEWWVCLTNEPQNDRLAADALLDRIAYDAKRGLLP